MSKIVALELKLMRAATPAERAAYGRLEALYDQMDDDDRREQGIHKPSDLASDRNPARYVTHYETGAYYTVTIHERGFIKIGVPGATDHLRHVLGSMLKRYANQRYIQYYAVAEIESDDGRPMGFRTVCARTEIPRRNVGH